MKPENVNSVLLVGAYNTNISSFLFQVGSSVIVPTIQHSRHACAMYWAKQGRKVLYLSGTSFDTLPPAIHGTPAPGSDSFSNIRFMYLPRRQDFLKQMYSIHLYAHIPKVIIVEGIEHYFHSNKASVSEKYESEVHAALVCASLLDAMSVCASCASDGAILVVSLEHNPSQSNKLDALMGMFFNDVVWLVDQVHGVDSKDGIIITDVASCPGETRRTRIEFESRKCDGALVLQKILSFVCV